MIFKEISVNTLYLGLLISTYFSATGQVRNGRCVNALYLGLLISTRHQTQISSRLFRCQCPLSWAAHFYCRIDILAPYICECVNALYLGLLISTPPLKIPSIYAAFRAYFCRYFSEYSENFFKKVLKVGKRRIVFLRYNFLQFNNQSYFRDFTDGFPRLLCYTFILITIIKSIKNLIIRITCIHINQLASPRFKPM